MKHQIIVAEIGSGNVQKISRHNVSTANGAARLHKSNTQLWMTLETAVALGAHIETFWGQLPDGTEIQIKNADVMETA